MPGQMSIVDYLGGAGKEYPSIMEIMKIMLAAEAKKNIDDVASIDPRAVRESVRDAARSARGTIGSSARGEPMPQPQQIMQQDPIVQQPQPNSPPRPKAPPEVIARLFPETEPGRGPGWLNPNNEAFVPQQVEPAYPSEGGFAQDEILRRFKELNPDLDYDAVARQSGGNVPGGSFSAVERKNVPKAQTDEEFIRWVNEDLPKYTASSMLDSRSREYNPEAAKIIFDRLAQERGDKAGMIQARGDELRGQADMARAQMIARDAELSRSPEGQVRSAIDLILQNVDRSFNPLLFDGAINAKMALANGNIKMAQDIINYAIQRSQEDNSAAQQTANQKGAPIVGR